jgi:hypothetical protein
MNVSAPPGKGFRWPTAKPVQNNTIVVITRHVTSTGVNGVDRRVPAITGIEILSKISYSPQSSGHDFPWHSFCSTKLFVLLHP